MRRTIPAHSGSLSVFRRPSRRSRSKALKRAKTDAGDVDEVLPANLRRGPVRTGTPGSRRRRHSGEQPPSGKPVDVSAPSPWACSRSNSAIRTCCRRWSKSRRAHCAHLRNGQKMGDLVSSTMIKDGLDAFRLSHGQRRERAEKYQITREQRVSLSLATKVASPESAPSPTRSCR